MHRASLTNRARDGPVAALLVFLLAPLVHGHTLAYWTFTGLVALWNATFGGGLTWMVLAHPRWYFGAIAGIWLILLCAEIKGVRRAFSAAAWIRGGRAGMDFFESCVIIVLLASVLGVIWGGIVCIAAAGPMDEAVSISRAGATWKAHGVVAGTPEASVQTCPSGQGVPYGKVCSDTDGHLYLNLAGGDPGDARGVRVFARMSGGLVVGMPGSRPGDVDMTVSRTDCMALARTRPSGVRLSINGGGGDGERCYYINNTVVIEPVAGMVAKPGH